MRRTSSRDDVFLSAVDLYSLLALVFLSLATVAVAPHPAGMVDLPVAEIELIASDGLPSSPVLKWEDPSQESGICRMLEERSSAVFDVPCNPPSFGQQTPSNLGGRVLPFRRDQPLQIRCRRQGPRALDSCARLQWMLAGQGYQVKALVGPQ